MVYFYLVSFCADFHRFLLPKLCVAVNRQFFQCRFILVAFPSAIYVCHFYRLFSRRPGPVMSLYRPPLHPSSFPPPSHRFLLIRGICFKLEAAWQRRTNQAPGQLSLPRPPPPPPPPPPYNVRYNLPPAVSSPPNSTHNPLCNRMAIRKGLCGAGAVLESVM